MIKHTNKIEILHDPVCGMEINPNGTDKVTNFQGLSYVTGGKPQQCHCGKGCIDS
jgi:hypothetical protein